MRHEASQRLLTISGYMIISAVVVLSMAYLPAMAGAVFRTLNILPAHLI